ncbi:hypothetical protein A2W24_05965 [Microgenomates group bacterium RBG_16_45_19]|nr:MAG: hypothetical protein A2W24_05965 [Microgenomates group bacterium RBG_16_45_19]
MLVTQIDGDKFQQFLYTEKGLSRNPTSHNSNTARFRLIQKFLVNLEWEKENFRDLISGMEERGNKPSTINKIITMGKYIDEYLGSDTTKGFKYRRERVAKIDNLLTPQEIRQLAEIQIAYSKFRGYINDRQKTLIMLLGTTGCRISEALNLTWDEVYLNPKPHVVFLLTKNGEDRKVPIGDEVYRLVQTLPHMGKNVFFSCRQGIYNLQQNNLDLKRRAKLCHINKRIYNHLFRHSFISTMLEIGTSESDVMKLVGHHDYKSLLRYKNSQLDYYSGVIRFHPLLNSEITWKERTHQLSELIHKIYDTDKFPLSIDCNESLVSITIRNLDSL